MVQLTKKIAELWRSNQVVRYAICGGGNMVFDWVLYFLLYNFVIGHEIVKLSIINYASYRNALYRFSDYAANRLCVAEIYNIY